MKDILVAVMAMFLLGVTTAARAEDLPPAGKLPDVGARVRVLAPSLGAGWHTGMFNRLRVEPPCYRVLIFSSGETRRVEAILSVRELTRLQVSASADSRSRSELPDRREQADPGEAWREVPLDLLRAAEQRCRLNRE